MPKRIQLSRRAGWRMPPGTKKVDRSTKWGNPFIVGKHGTQGQCVAWHRELLETENPVTAAPVPIGEQLAHLAYVKRNLHTIIGSDVACWCRLSQQCHGDNYLRLSDSIKCEDVK